MNQEPFSQNAFSYQPSSASPNQQDPGRFHMPPSGNESQNGNFGSMPPQYPSGQRWYPQAPNPTEKHSRVGSFFLSFLPFLAYIGLQFIAFIIAMFLYLFLQIAFNGGRFQLEELISAITQPSLVLFHLMGVGAFLVWYYLMLKKPRPKLGNSIKICKGESYVVAIIMGILMCIFSSGVVSIETLVVPQVVEDFYELAQTAGLGYNPFVIFTTIVLAPIGEELCFRGVTMKFAQRAFPKHFWIANILQALLFGVLHMNWVHGVYAFGGGLVLGWVAKRYRSVFPAILMHFTVNFLSTFGLDYLLSMIPLSYATAIATTIVPIAIAILLMIWRREPETTST